MEQNKSFEVEGKEARQLSWQCLVAKDEVASHRSGFLKLCAMTHLVSFDLFPGETSSVSNENRSDGNIRELIASNPQGY